MRRLRARAVGPALALVLAAWASAPLGARAEDPIDIIVRGGDRDYRVALQRFEPDARSAGYVPRFYDQLRDALEFAGTFKMIAPEAFLEPLQTRDYGNAFIPCDNWLGIGADVLVQGRIEGRGDGHRVRYRVWDLSRCRLEGDPAYFDGSADDLWLIAKRIADDVVLRWTGRRGVAGTQIAFVSDVRGNKEIYVMEADGANKRRVTANRQINLFPAWSPDGSTLLYTSYRSGAPDLWTVARGRPGGRVFNLRGERYRGIFGPVDGQVTLVMHTDGNTDIYLARGDGRGLKRLTDARSIEVSPSWSPDGSQLAFASDRSGSQQVYVMDVATGETRRLTFRGSYNASPAWSPDGQWIAYAALTGSTYDLYLIDPETRHTRLLTDHPRTEEDPAWSPDSRKLAFTSNRRGTRDLYVIDVPSGRNLRRITSGFGNASNPAWSTWVD